ncbi:glycosyltransferase [Microbulbifer sp. MCCC 1A16149]|uniref:glycosyltransferase n=1 Tax=Microbulbifer sp. MCCC 1A16149 TaxID=3411322 RepID=UPI003D1337AD
MSELKVAVVHYWLTGMRGGEKVLESICRLYPNADIYTHVYIPEKISETIKQHKITTTFIARLPFAKKKYQMYLPLMPLALEQLDLTAYDLVISSESGPAKGVVTRPDALHICYCHSPMRYVWDMYHSYIKNAGFLKKLLMAPLIHYLKIWDYSSAARVDYFIANSSYVSQRIKKIYRREAHVINPPVEVDAFSISEEIDDYYLLLGQLVPYKRPDLAVEAFVRSGRNLIVIGEGECLNELKRKANGSGNIKFLGRQDFAQIKRYYARCKALVFPGIEDFGIVPLESMASGRPVIAFGAGGAMDSVLPGRTGIFFQQQTVSALNDAVDRFEQDASRFSPQLMKDHAEKFSVPAFENALQNYIESKVNPTDTFIGTTQWASHSVA